jgi:hypothetical protein
MKSKKKRKKKKGMQAAATCEQIPLDWFYTIKINRLK